MTRASRNQSLGLRVFIATALSLAAACAGSREVQEPTAKKSLTATELRDLLKGSSIQPVETMSNEDPLAGANPEMKEYADPARAQALDSDQKPAAGRDAAAQSNPAAKPAAPATSAANSPPTSAPPQPNANPGAAADAPVPAQKPAAPPPENPYLRFGERIRVNPDGTISKPFPLRPGTGKNLQTLIVNFGNFPIWSDKMGPGPSSPTTVKLDLLEGWDGEIYQDLRAPAGATAAPVALADWLVVTAGPDLLGEVEDFINLFAASVPQIEIEAKVVEVTLSDVLDLGVKPVAGKPVFDFPGSATFFKSLDYSLPNQSNGIGALLTVGSIQDGTAFNAVIQALQNHQNVSIINQPKIAVREGGRAEINAITHLPYLQVSGINNAGGYGVNVAFQDTGIKLFVIPRVVGTRTVALNIDVEASQQTGSQIALVTPTNQAFTVPTLSTRSAKTIVYLQPGQAVILGGLITERTVEQISKVPLLGDIPLIQYLFRSKFTSKEQTDVLFFIRPRILQGVDLNRQF